MTDTYRLPGAAFPGVLLPLAFFLALWSLLVPAFGPMFSTQFAGRDPYHGHIALSGPVVPHVHTYRDMETDQTRVHMPQEVPSSDPSGAANDGLIYVTAENGSSSASFVSLVMAAIQFLVFPDLDNSWPGIPPRTLIQQAFPSPLWNPPKL